jgi:hypothetical protein
MGCNDAIHGWMMGHMDGWKASFRPRHPLIYVIVQKHKFNHNTKMFI